MSLSSLQELKKHEVFMALNQKQSEFDAIDPALLKDQFTRSPMHAIQFLIAYAGLDDAQRHHVVTNLQSPAITKIQLDDLITEINWIDMLKTPANNNLSFQFTIGIANKRNFLNAVKEKCPSLYTALNNGHSIVKIEATDQVVFKTTIAQEELWTLPFTREDVDAYWTVPCFQASPALIRLMEVLKENETTTVGGLTLKKGSKERGHELELHVTAPYSSNQYSIASKIEATPGIYGAFIDLKNFYGLNHVDGVLVKIESKANFSDQGASASQTQTTTFMEECAWARSSEPSIITVNHLNVFFQGADIIASFTKGMPKADDFSAQCYINLPTQSRSGTSIKLLAHAPNPLDAFELVKRAPVAHASSSNLLKHATPTPVAHASWRNKQDIYCAQKGGSGINYTFCLNGFSSIAKLAGGTLLVAGLATFNPLLLGVGVGLGTTGFAITHGLFAHKEAHLGEKSPPMMTYTFDR
ncbi:MAG: hypothetical protein ACHP65_10375 [Legionellales bacterium]